MKGKKQLKEIMEALLENDIGFDYINGVLYFDKLPKGVKGLWYWFGNLLVAKENQRVAREMEVLDSWSFDKQNNFIIVNSYTRGE